MCDDIGKYCLGRLLCQALLTSLAAGTLRYAEIKPKLPPSAFSAAIRNCQDYTRSVRPRLAMNTSRRRSRSDTNNDIPINRGSDNEEFLDDNIDDTDMIAVGRRNSST